MSIALFSAASPADAAARPFEPAPLLIAFAVLALAAFSPAALNDGDTWTHVATGQWILAHGAVPRVDPFSFTFAGQPWTAHEWLSEVLMALAYHAAGWSGVALLTGVAAATAVFVMARRAARDLSGVALLVACRAGRAARRAGPAGAAAHPRAAAAWRCGPTRCSRRAKRAARRRSSSSR